MIRCLSMLQSLQSNKCVRSCVCVCVCNLVCGITWMHCNHEMNWISSINQTGRVQQVCTFTKRSQMVSSSSTASLSWGTNSEILNFTWACTFVTCISSLSSLCAYYSNVNLFYLLAYCRDIIHFAQISKKRLLWGSAAKSFCFVPYL